MCVLCLRVRSTLLRQDHAGGWRKTRMARTVCNCLFGARSLPFLHRPAHFISLGKKGKKERGRGKEKKEKQSKDGHGTLYGGAYHGPSCTRSGCAPAGILSDSSTEYLERHTERERERKRDDVCQQPHGKILRSFSRQHALPPNRQQRHANWPMTKPLASMGVRGQANKALGCDNISTPSSGEAQLGVMSYVRNTCTPVSR